MYENPWGGGSMASSCPPLPTPMLVITILLRYHYTNFVSMFLNRILQ